MPQKKRNKKTVTVKKTPSAKSEGVIPSGANIRLGDSFVSLFLGALVVVVAAVLGFFYVKLQQPRQELLPPATIARNINVTINLTNPANTQTTVRTATATPAKAMQPEKRAVQAKPTTAITPLAKMQPEKKTPEVKPIVTTQPTTSLRGKKHIVQKGENLWQIAVKEYGSGYSWVSIAQANHLSNPGVIFSGDTLIIPSVTPILLPSHAVSPTPTKTVKPTVTPTPTKAPVISPTPTIAFKGNSYKVQRGDSLWTIAVKAYGNGYRYVDIIKANQLVNPGVIFAGNTLRIPRP